MRTRAVLGAEATGVFQMPASEDSGLAAIVSQSLGTIDGVRSVVVNYVTDNVYVSYDPTKVSSLQIKRAMTNAGIRARRTPQGKKDGANKMGGLHHG